MSENMYDVAIIGAGPAGYVAALEARKCGLSCLLIEKENNLGGTCLNCGCIPTKSLIAAAESFHNAVTCASFGVNAATGVTFDYAAAKERTDKIVAKLNAGIAILLKKAGAEVKNGLARFRDKNALEVTNGEKTETVSAKNIIIAVGAKPKELKGLEPDEKFIMNSKQALAATDLPESCLIIGGGAIGLEFASLYSTLGVKVIVAEYADTIIPFADKEVITAMAAAFKKQGIEILTAHQAEKVEKESKTAVVTLKDKAGNTCVREVQRVICAAGIEPLTENLGLENVARVKVERGHIVTDEFGKTGEDNIFAVGDVANAPWLAHKASAEAVRCIRHIAGQAAKPVNLELIPSCIYTRPQMAGVGLTEDAARQKGYQIAVGKTFFMANGKAVASGQADGFVKVIRDKEKGDILGAWIVGENASELISNLIPLPVDEKVFPHPSMSESISEALALARE